MHRYLTWLKLRSMTIPKAADAFTIYKSEKVRSKCFCLTSTSIYTNMNIQFARSLRWMWKSVYGYAGILGLDILLLSDIQGWPRVHTRWLRSPTLDKDYFCIVSTVISVLTDTLLKRTPRVSPCILLLLLVYLNNPDICLGALSICQNWPAALDR